MCVCSVPDTPADVKVIVMNATAVTIAWRPPQHANGIVVHYVVVWKDATLPAVGLMCIKTIPVLNLS